MPAFHGCWSEPHGVRIGRERPPCTEHGCGFRYRSAEFRTALRSLKRLPELARPTAAHGVAREYFARKDKFALAYEMLNFGFRLKHQIGELYQPAGGFSRARSLWDPRANSFSSSRLRLYCPPPLLS